jgi:Tfp pilus assembly protein PilF
VHRAAQRATQGVAGLVARPARELRGNPLANLDIKHVSLQVARILLAALFCVGVWAAAARGQDVGSEANAIRGNGAEIEVMVHDRSGELITSPVTIKVLRNGALQVGEGSTTRGSLVFVVTPLGDFTVVVEATGYQKGQKDVSVPLRERTQVDIYLQRDSDAGNVTAVPGRPLLAPKAREALNKGLQALRADKLAEAEKYSAVAMRLAPGHPDVLYLQGVVDLKQRRFVDAQGDLEKATQIDPTHAQAFAALGMALADQGKYEAAIAPLEKSLQLRAATAWETRWTLARVYYWHEQYDEALKTSQEALAESNGKAPEIELLIAQSLTAVGRYEDSATTLRDFLRNHGDRPEAATARRWLERLESSGKIQANNKN